MPGPTSQRVRGEIIAYINAGLTKTEVSRLCRVNKSTVYRLLRQLEVEGNVNPRPIPGRPRCTTAENDGRLLQLVQENGFRSANQTVEEMVLNCSAETVRRRWREQGYHHHIPAQKQSLTPQHTEQRMGFALQHLPWDNEWENTIFSDEKVFSTDESGRVTLWRIKGTRYNESNVYFRERSGHVTLAFWGCMTSHGPGPLVRTTPHMNGEEYVNILSNVMIPYVAETFPGVPRVNFVQDNSGVHRSRLVQNWLATQPNLNTLNWPAKSPDMNVIENLWGIIVQEWNPQIRRTREALEQHVLNVWEGFRTKPELFQNLVQSMPQRLTAVIENHGSVTRY